ncbi:MAG: hypothetical protein HKO53_06210 [Gemmatimonadetes bacterium]|nr:hypothetical protein [Gemmatimonadota bacterium]
MKPFCDLGDQQRQVLSILWTRGPSTVKWVREELDPELAYTSVLSVLQKLESMGWVGHARDGRTHVYSATRSQAQARRESLDVFRRRVYQDDANALFRDAATPSREPLTLKSLVQRRQARAA